MNGGIDIFALKKARGISERVVGDKGGRRGVRRFFGLRPLTALMGDVLSLQRFFRPFPPKVQVSYLEKGWLSVEEIPEMWHKGAS